MKAYEIRIEWDGPYHHDEIIEKKNDVGTEQDNWGGDDYGVYQIYGRHILCGKNALLYIGQASDRTFAQRFKDHKKWLDDDQDKEDIKIFLGRVSNTDLHSPANDWKEWYRDINLVEKILIYKYSPNYNSRELTSEPDLSPFGNVSIINLLVKESNRLEAEDNAPNDFHNW